MKVEWRNIVIDIVRELHLTALGIRQVVEQIRANVFIQLL